MISTVGNVTEARRAKITFPAVYIPHPTSPSEMANCVRQQCVIGIFCGAFPDIHDYGVVGNTVGSHNSPSPKAMPTHNTYTAGNGNFTSFISIPYCANHDLPSPTDFHLLTTKEPAVGAGSDSVISVTAVQSGGR